MPRRLILFCLPSRNGIESQLKCSQGALWVILHQLTELKWDWATNSGIFGGRLSCVDMFFAVFSQRERERGREIQEGRVSSLKMVQECVVVVVGRWGKLGGCGCCLLLSEGILQRC